MLLMLTILSNEGRSWTRWSSPDFPAPRVSENPRLDVWITFRNTNKNVQTRALWDEYSLGSDTLQSSHGTIVLTCTMLFWPVTCFNTNTFPTTWKETETNWDYRTHFDRPMSLQGAGDHSCWEEKALLLLLAAQGHWDGEGDGRGIQAGEHMYTHGGFMWRYGKNHHSIVK